jgi:CelD/BcsL family acetyltransferase involved in cellulose biosynthesis
MIEKIDTTIGFERLKDTWQELLEASSSNCFFLTWEWLFTWWKHLSGGRKLFILSVESEKKTIGLAPFVIGPARLGIPSLRTVEFLGSGTVGSDYLDVIARRGAEEETVDRLAEYLGEQKVMLELGQLGQSSLASRLAERLVHQKRYRSLPVKTDICPYIDLVGQTWNSYLATLGSSHRSNFHRRVKQLQSNFEFRFEMARTEKERRVLLAALIELHRKRWQGKGASEAFSTPDMMSFHEQVSLLALERGWLRLYVLWLNGCSASALYGFRHDSRFYFFQSGLDPKYARYSVGLVTMGLAIKNAIEDGAKEYDLLHGDESYKFLWTRQSRDLQKLELYPPNTLGLLCGQISHAGRFVRQLGWTVLPKPVAEKIATARRLASLKGYYAAQSR